MFDLAKTGPVPADLGTRLVFEEERIPLAHLVEALDAAGQRLQGRRFVDCVVHGPAVVIPDSRTQFLNCNLGEVEGDVRNLFLRAAGRKIIGAIALNDSVFEGCLFVGVGMAGDDAFVDAFVEKLRSGKA